MSSKKEKERILAQLITDPATLKFTDAKNNCFRVFQTEAGGWELAKVVKIKKTSSPVGLMPCINELLDQYEPTT